MIGTGIGIGTTDMLAGVQKAQDAMLDAYVKYAVLFIGLMAVLYVIQWFEAKALARKLQERLDEQKKADDAKLASLVEDAVRKGQARGRI